MRLQRGREACDVGLDDVMRDQIAHALEPERRQLREYLAFVGDAGSEDVIERGNAIGGDHDQVVAGGIDVTDLASPNEGKAVQFRI